MLERPLALQGMFAPQPRFKTVKECLDYYTNLKFYNQGKPRTHVNPFWSEEDSLLEEMIRLIKK
ncbi:hypothetical protein ACX818_001360 [Acinetobacter baumannii]